MSTQVATGTKIMKKINTSRKPYFLALDGSVKSANRPFKDNIFFRPGEGGRLLKADVLNGDDLKEIAGFTAYLVNR